MRVYELDKRVEENDLSSSQGMSDEELQEQVGDEDYRAYKMVWRAGSLANDVGFW